MRIIRKQQAARRIHRTTRTIENWIGQGNIKGYRVASGDIGVDLDELEAFLAEHPRHDGRLRYGPKAQIVDAPSVVLGEDS